MRFAFFAVASLAALPAVAAPPSPLVVVSWDGGADWVVDKLLAEGKLPNVARMTKTGVRAASMTPAFPSKTAVGHAALWTGAWSNINGVSGNSVPLLPRAQHTVLEQRSGFDSHSLLAEPLFVTAAKAGKNVVVLSATQSFPADPWLAKLKAAGVPRERYRSWSGFETSISPDKIWNCSQIKAGQRRWTFSVGDSQFNAEAWDDPADKTVGLDTIRIEQTGTNKTIYLKPAPASDKLTYWSPAFRVRKGENIGNVYFRLFDLKPTGEMVLYQRAVNGLRGAATAQETENYLSAYGGFHAAPWRDYERGALGKPLWENGDGTAENRLLETVRLDCEFLKRANRYALQAFRPDLVFQYSPQTDTAGHTWMGALDPDSPHYNKQIADKLWPFYTQVFQLQDNWLGSILDSVGKNGAVCLVSDHGMEGLGNRFAPNVALERAGLLQRNADGTINLSRTKALVPPWSDYFVIVNTTDWKNGIVPPAERNAVLRQAEKALLTAEVAGQRMVTAVFRPDELTNLGLGGATGGDLYLDLAPGWWPSSRTDNEVIAPDNQTIGIGMHGAFPFRRKLQAIFYLSGAGVARNREIGSMRQIDVAPTLAQLIGITVPPQSEGQILGGAIADKNTR